MQHVNRNAMTDATSFRTRLQQLALNLWWTWQPDVIELFRDLDPFRWRQTNHNPVALLLQLGDEELQKRVIEQSLEARLNFHYRRLQEYLLASNTWCDRQASALLAAPVAYFSAEFGLHESLPLYSGGLGVLAGDFLKSASDLGLPVVGVGLYYAKGYFRQHLDETGWQCEDYDTTLIADLPIERAAAADGSALTIQVPCGREAVHAGIWVAHVGRGRLLLLDSNVAANVDPGVRGLSSNLYGGDELARIRQEILLGIGGLRALRAVGIRPVVLHLNEGHSAFAILERVRERVEEDGLSFEAALRETAIQTVFTTHTPVESGHDRFPPELLEQELGWLRTKLGVDQSRFMALGRVRATDAQESFCMTVLGLKARGRNAVSALHGHVSRQMWRDVWSGRGEEDIPIGHITNGVHVLSWLAPSMKRIYDRQLGPDWPLRQADPATWRPIAQVDDSELWEAHTVLRRKLVEFTRRRAGTTALLDPSALVGFARRFATYKRATLVLSDVDRFARLCADRARPVQFVFAGKAHPRDDAGKALIREIVALSRDSRFAGRIAFVEDYDVNVARHLVQGIDLWLNTPARPLEACGTSGQKVLLNGGLNCSVLDGWWVEAYDGENGFGIGSRNVHADWSVQWRRDASSLYDVLEREVLPLFYDLDPSEIIPRRWIARMKRAMLTLAWRFNASRMVTDYVRACYLQAAGGLSQGTA